MQLKITLCDPSVGITTAAQQAEELTRSTGRYHYSDYCDLANVMFVADTGCPTEDAFWAAVEARMFADRQGATI